MLQKIWTCRHRHKYVSRKVNHFFDDLSVSICCTCSFHNKLKTSYLNGKVNRRVDVLLEVLLKIEHDQYFQYEMKHRLQQQNKIVKRDHCRHKRGMSIPCSKVEVIYNVHELVRCVYVQHVGCQWKWMAHTKSVRNQSVRLHSLQSVDGVSWDQLYHEVCISRMWKSVLPSVQMRQLMLWLHKWTHM